MPSTTLTKSGGNCSFSYPLRSMVEQLPNGQYTVEIKRLKRARTLDQNRLYWAWLGCLAEATGTPAADFHDYYKLQFNSRIAQVAGHPVVLPSSTTTLSTEQFSLYMQMVQADAATSFGVTLPSPDDPFFTDFMSRYSRP